MPMDEVAVIRNGNENARVLRSILSQAKFPPLRVLDWSNQLQAARKCRFEGGVLAVVAAFDRRIVESVVREEVAPTVRFLGSTPLVVAGPVCSPAVVRQCLSVGASDVWAAPFRAVDLIGRVLKYSSSSSDCDRSTATERISRPGKIEGLLGQSAAWLKEVRKIEVLARADVPVVIEGETGTGKELCARALHDLSRRSGLPFVAINCGAIPVDLAENELFGHQAGAYTGAASNQVGLIEQADGGTLFLDEVDSLPLFIQVKLLRFIQDSRFRPLGCGRERVADVRIVAATNCDLASAMDEGRFRRDLFYRLNVGYLQLPPLRERMDDIELLAGHFLRSAAVVHNKDVGCFSPTALNKLKAYHWPGNVRELQNVVERAVLFSEGPEVRPEEIVCGSEQSPHLKFVTGKADLVRAFEREQISELLAVHQGNISAAARAAGMDRSTLYRLLRRHHVSTDGNRPVDR